VSAADVVIVGAGPYGLSVAAHLRSIKGLDVRVLGEPMSFWAQHMPCGMLLRSPYVASHLSDPEGVLTLDTFQVERGARLTKPVPLSAFVDYGRWFQQKVAPDVDTRKVVRIERIAAKLKLTLDDGEQVSARRVVIATGIGHFVHRPASLNGLPSQLVSHASEHSELSCFNQKRVLVVGGGQSALESAALLHESGARVEMVIRERTVHWLGQRKWAHVWPLRQLLHAPPDVGPAVVSHLTAHPNLYRRLPREWQDRLGVRSIRPAGAAWLKPRLDPVPIRVACGVTSAVAVNGHLRVRLSDGSERHVDHVLLGTGYRVDIRRSPFLAPGLLSAIRQTNGYPHLDAGFESSARGLHFVGAPAAWSFGPLMRFVAGAAFTSRALTHRLLVQH